jgi:hypothetical protein
VITSQRLGSRRGWFGVSLTGGRRAIDHGLVGLLALAGAVATIGLVVGRHRVSPCWDDCAEVSFGDWHSYVLELYGVPVILTLVGFGLAVGSPRRIGRRLLAGFVNILHGITTFVLLIACHGLDSQQDTLGTKVGFVGLLGMIAAGLLVMLVVPLLALAERRRLEAHDPVFPGARVVG